LNEGRERKRRQNQKRTVDCRTLPRRCGEIRLALDGKLDCENKMGWVECEVPAVMPVEVSKLCFGLFVLAVAVALSMGTHRLRSTQN